MNGKLTIILGPMFAGKSTYIINEVKHYNSSDILVIKHLSDDRYQQNCIVSHDNISCPCIPYKTLSDMINNENVKLRDVKTIFIDEAQFFSDLYDKVLYLILVRKINVVLVGLDGDFERKAFGNGDLLKLIPLASYVHKFISKCYICGQDAPFTKRLIASKEQIVVGGANIYQPACEEHFSNI